MVAPRFSLATVGDRHSSSSLLRRAIGVSNFSSKKLQGILDACSIRPAVNQVCCAPMLLPPATCRCSCSRCRCTILTRPCCGVTAATALDQLVVGALEPPPSPLVNHLAAGGGPPLLAQQRAGQLVPGKPGSRWSVEVAPL